MSIVTSSHGWSLVEVAEVEKSSRTENLAVCHCFSMLMHEYVRNISLWCVMLFCVILLYLMLCHVWEILGSEWCMIPKCCNPQWFSHDFLVDDILQPDTICLLEIIKQVASLFFGARKLCLLGRTKILNASSWSSQKKSLKDKDIIYIHTLYIYIIYICIYILIPSPKYQIPFTLKPKNSSWICWIPNKGHKNDALRWWHQKPNCHRSRPCLKAGSLKLARIPRIGQIGHQPIPKSGKNTQIEGWQKKSGKIGTTSHIESQGILGKLGQALAAKFMAFTPWLQNSVALENSHWSQWDFVPFWESFVATHWRFWTPQWATEYSPVTPAQRRA